MTRYRSVDARKADGFPVTLACATVEVSTSAYYAWAAREQAGPTDTERREQQLVELIRLIHFEFDGVYGAPRMSLATVMGPGGCHELGTTSGCWPVAVPASQGR